MWLCVYIFSCFLVCYVALMVMSAGERVQRVHTGLRRDNKYGWSLFGWPQGECKIGGIHAPFMNNWFLLFPMKTQGIVAALSGCIGWGVLWPFKRRLRGPCSVPRVFNGDRTHLRKTPLCPCFSKETKESSSLSLWHTQAHTHTQIHRQRGGDKGGRKYQTWS